ncbi:MAG TPA: acyl-CoA dehydratase activase-related protein [Negativicutes bacterium]
MPVHVGIPRAMLYHEFGGLWTAFFQNLGIPLTVSDETNQQILDRGTMLAVDESCLPLKIYLGHVESLLPKCTHIFIPRIAGYYENFFLCAKFAGLPDIVRNTFNLSPDQLIAPNIESKSPVTQLKAIHTTCRATGVSKLSGYLAFHQAKKYWKTDLTCCPASGPKIAIVGHSYVLNDTFFCRDILNTLAKRGIRTITPEHIPSKLSYQQSAVFQPDIYWQLSAKLAGAVRFFSQQPDIDGIILVSSFGCGPDSLINDYVEHRILKNSSKPYIIINLDEHTGSAGIVTRIEAFLDLADRR